MLLILPALIRDGQNCCPKACHNKRKCRPNKLSGRLHRLIKYQRSNNTGQYTQTSNNSPYLLHAVFPPYLQYNL